MTREDQRRRAGAAPTWNAEEKVSGYDNETLLSLGRGATYRDVEAAMTVYDRIWSAVHEDDITLKDDSITFRANGWASPEHLDKQHLAFVAAFREEFAGCGVVTTWRETCPESARGYTKSETYVTGFVKAADDNANGAPEAQASGGSTASDAEPRR